METPKVFESEYRFCLILWEHEPIPSGELGRLCNEQLGWKQSTTYTVIKKCIAKGAIERTEPNFQCHALIPKEVVQEADTAELIGKLFDGSPDLLFASLLGHQKLSRDQIERLRRMVDALE